jgi:hypothetical protein
MKFEKIKVRGKDVDAELIDVSQSSERWNEYLLDDGSVLKIKFILKKVYRLPNEFDPQGNPIYLAESQNILSSTSPDHLKRR